jgi:hypothetical protein
MKCVVVGFCFLFQTLGKLTPMTMVFLFISLMNWTLPVRAMNETSVKCLLSYVYG